MSRRRLVNLSGLVLALLIVTTLIALGSRGGAASSSPYRITAAGLAADSVPVVGPPATVPPTTAPPATGALLPNPALTPGAVFPVGLDQICVSGYSSSVRDVSEATKDQVYAEYGVTSHVTGQYEVDHLIPLELGGSNDITNLWPEPAEPTPGFHQKDVLENKLHDLACSGQLDLATAQHAIATDWYQAYQQYVLGSSATPTTPSASPTPSTPTATPTVAPTPTSAGYSLPGCYHPGQNSCNCSDFTTHSWAQWFHDTYDPTDVNRLDSNHDGVVCESLPG